MTIKIPKTKIRICVWIIGILIFISALSKYKLLSFILYSQSVWDKAFVVMFFVSSLLSLFALLFQKQWGFIFVYLYISIATYYFAISTIPFLFGFLNLSGYLATKVLIAINIGVFIFAVAVQIIKFISEQKIKNQLTKRSSGSPNS